MKKNTKKGFTIVELVIVIAVIAILSAVLIPTFSSVVKKAEESAALQEATSAVTILLSEEDGQLDTTEGTTYNIIYKNGKNEYWYTVTDNKIKTATKGAITVGKEDKVWFKGTSQPANVTYANDLKDLISSAEGKTGDQLKAINAQIDSIIFDDTSDLSANIVIWKDVTPA